MLNFGPLAVPVAFAVLGLVVRRVRRMLATMVSDDTRFLLYPLLINLCFVILVSDSDNVLFFVLKNGALPFLLVAVISRRATVRTPSLSASDATPHRPRPLLPLAPGLVEPHDP
jgi:hypothetical protein